MHSVPWRQPCSRKSPRCCAIWSSATTPVRRCAALRRSAPGSNRSTPTSLSIKGGLNPRGNRLDVGESGLSTRLFTPVASALPDPHRHRRPRVAAQAPDDDDARPAAAVGRHGARQRRVPAHRGVRADPRRRGRSRRFGLVAIHHGAAALAAAGRKRHHAARAQRRLDPLSGHDARHGRTLRHRDQPTRLRGVLHPGAPALRRHLLQHRGRLERRGDAAGGGRHGRGDHRSQRLDALETGRHGHLHGPRAGRCPR